jgi:hypothetical protein
MAKKDFLERAPKEVIDESIARRAQLIGARERLEEAKQFAAEL